MSYRQTKSAWAKQQMLADLKETQASEPVLLDIERWRKWIAVGVTEYSSVHGTCVWNGKDVFIDAQAPYVTSPDPDFPVECHMNGLRLYLAWPVWNSTIEQEASR
ncbi:MAG: hypothetical protein AAF449_00390 [Myxococcota bacterium]